MKTIRHRFSLHFQLLGIFDMLQLTAAAFLKKRTDRLDALFRGNEHFQNFAESDVLFYFQHLISDFFAQKSKGKKNYASFFLDDSFAVRPHGGYERYFFVVFLYHRLPFDDLRQRLVYVYLSDLHELVVYKEKQSGC